MQDMAGGIDIGGEGVEITNAKPIFIMEKEETSNSAASLSSFEDDEPTEEEKRTLRKVADRLPWSAYLVAMVELCERFTYYGLSGPFQNYIQNSYNDPSELPGAIGDSAFSKLLPCNRNGKLTTYRPGTDCGNWLDRCEIHNKTFQALRY